MRSAQVVLCRHAWSPNSRSRFESMRTRQTLRRSIEPTNCTISSCWFINC